MKEESIECPLCARHNTDTESAVRIFRIEYLQQMLYGLQSKIFTVWPFTVFADPCS